MSASCLHLLCIVTLVAAAAAASVRGRCESDRYFDDVVKQCTPCTDICDPSRGTEYLCVKHVDVCNGKLDLSFVVYRPRYDSRTLKVPLKINQLNQPYHVYFSYSSWQ